MSDNKAKRIKTRVSIKDIKVIDKSIVNRMKRVSSKTKDAVNQQLQPEENSANFSANYAVDKTSKIARHAARKSGQQLQKTIKIGRKKGIQKPTDQTVLPSTSSDAKKAIKKPLKSMTKKPTKGIKTTTLTSQISQKTRKVIKTRKAIKTTEQTRRMIRSSARNAKRSMQATRATIRTIKTAVFATKIAVKATIVAIKGAVVSTKALVTLAVVGGSLAVLIIFAFTLFGAALTFSNESGGGDTTSLLSDEVLAHEPLIRYYAEIHGIPEHIPLIMAVMMQESGGRGLDPMQASESGYNTRFPRVPNAITDVEYSINVGIQTLASCFRMAGVEHPFDMDNIKLGLQGYNFGSYYITWAIRRGEGYTPENAIEFSFMMANRLGWSSYGDINYVPNVLRFWSGANITSPDNSLAGDFQSPFPNLNVTVTSEFGYRTIQGNREFHTGIDLVAHHLAPVSAVAGGTVVTARFCSGYGFYVTIRHNNGMYSRYAHLDRLQVRINQTVSQGQTLGLQGNTGRSFGSHLHLEIRTSNSYGRTNVINPREFFDFR